MTERAQPLATKEAMKASFEAYLMVLIVVGSARCFTKADHEMIEDDLKHLKRVFATYGEGLITEDVVEKEAETVEGVVALMEKLTEQLVEDFTVVACEATGHVFKSKFYEVHHVVACIRLILVYFTTLYQLQYHIYIPKILRRITKRPTKALLHSPGRISKVHEPQSINPFCTTKATFKGLTELQHHYIYTLRM